MPAAGARYADFRVAVYEHRRDIDQQVASRLAGERVPPLPSSEEVARHNEAIDQLGPDPVAQAAEDLYRTILQMDTRWADPKPLDKEAWDADVAKREALRQRFREGARGATVGRQAFVRGFVPW